MRIGSLIELSIQGDLRFASHLDSLRLIERLVHRADLPVHYSQGYNPRPAISLPMPRPVGVAARRDPLVVELDEPVAFDELPARMNRTAPPGLCVRAARAMPSPKAPRPLAASYALEVEQDEDAVRQHLAGLLRQDAWPVQRRVKNNKRKGQWRSRTLDLRPLVDGLTLRQQSLQFRLVRQGDTWARPGEVLGLLGLDERRDLARLVRLSVDLQIEHPPQGAGRSPDAARVKRDHSS